jgi:uncharacterized protein (TIGR02001 family)
MKKTALILAALFTGAALSADEAPAAPTSSYSITADIPYVSTYVFRGTKLATGSLQPSLKLTSGAAYGGIWFSQPLNSDYENEIDFYGGYTFALSKSWGLDVGATYYYYPELDTSGGADSGTIEGYVGLTGTITGALTGSVYVYRDFTLDATTVQGSLGYSVPLDEKLSMNLGVNVGTVSPDDGDDYLYYGASVTFPWKISDKATITSGFNYATNDIDGAPDDQFWVNFGFTYAF